MTEPELSQIMDTVGRTLAARRKYLRLTLRDVKDRTGVDTATLSLYERGKVASFRMDILVKLAIALGVPLDQLIEPFIAHVQQHLPEEYR